MLNNIKYIGIIFLSLLLLTNCKKDNKEADVKSQGEIVFAAIDANLDKSDVFDIECLEDVVVTHARINLDGTFYYPEVFELAGKLYTQSLKLDLGTYTILEFSLMTGIPGDGIPDVVVKSTPMWDSHYAQFLTPGYGLGDDLFETFEVFAFEKAEFDVEVLCYIEAAYTGFGFEWFDITEMTIREQCFFGDFCIKDVNQYANSMYSWDGSVDIDEVAIFKIVATYNYADPVEYYNFVDGEYVSPLCIEYADYDMVVDNYKFELWIYVTYEEGWDYVLFHTWEFQDDYMIPAGDDGVVDFVLGNCVMDTPDLLLPPWMNLPMGTEFDFTLSNGANGASSYWDIAIANVPDGYDIWNGDYAGWCADEGVTIGAGLHCMNAMSSLYPENLPDYWLTTLPSGPDALTRLDAICAANWLWNNEGDYVYTINQMQNALWNLFNNKAVSGIAKTMADDARDHCDFSPLPGGWAAIFFAPCDASNALQMTFFVVDP